MEEQLARLPVGSGGVITRMKKAPRLEQMGLRPGAVVTCVYKSRGVQVLELGRCLMALRRQALRGIRVDY